MKKFLYQRTPKKPKKEHMLAVIDEIEKRLKAKPEVMSREDVYNMEDDEIRFNVFFGKDAYQDDSSNTVYVEAHYVLPWEKDTDIPTKYAYIRFTFHDEKIKKGPWLSQLDIWRDRLTR